MKIDILKMFPFLALNWIGKLSWLIFKNIDRFSWNRVTISMKFIKLQKGFSSKKSSFHFFLHSTFFIKSFESKKKRLQKHSETEHSKERKARRKKSMFRKLFIQTIMEDTESQIWPIEISTTCNVNLRKVFLTQARPEWCKGPFTI